MAPVRSLSKGDFPVELASAMFLRRAAISFLSPSQCIGFAVALLLIVFAGITARATTFHISDTRDTTNVTSLRGAIIAANKSGGFNTIILTSAVYPLTIPGTDETASRTGDLNITNGNLTIRGSASTLVTITATNLGDRVLRISSNANVTLSSLAFTGGVSPNGPFESDEEKFGGGIFNAGTLAMDHCNISGNQTATSKVNSYGYSYGPAGNGAGLHNSGVASLTACQIIHNACGHAERFFPGQGACGGGICNTGSILLTDCSVTENSTGAGASFDGFETGSDGGDGGGIYNIGNATLNNCLLSSNATGAGFEGIVVYSYGTGFGGHGGKGGDGGAVFNAGSITLNACMITNNICASGGKGGGGDIYSFHQSYDPYIYDFLSFDFAAYGGPGGNGAGIFSSGILSMNLCTLYRNICGNGGDGGSGATTDTSPVGGVGGSGGGVFSTGTLKLANCTLAANYCGNGGNGGDGYRSNSDIDRDSLASGHGYDGGHGGSGGGVYSAGPSAFVACSVLGNSGGLGGKGGVGYPGYYNFGPYTEPRSDGIGGLGGNGGDGGLFSAASNNVVDSLVNCLVASNSAGIGGTAGYGITTNGEIVPVLSAATNGFTDLNGNFSSGGHNLIGIFGSSTGFANGIKHDLVGSSLNPINPLLAPLANNGSNTLTMSPLPGSPAIDAGDDALLSAPYNLTTDQRGQPRRYAAHVDIGAVEYNGKLNGLIQPPFVMNEQKSGAGFQFTFAAATKNSYSVLVTTNFVNWTLLGPAIETSPGFFSFKDASGTNAPRRFYRIRSQ